MNFLITILLFLLILPVTSCNKDFLDKAPGVDVTEDLIFSSQTEVETTVAGLYLQGVHSMYGLHNAVEGSIAARFGTKGASDEGEMGASWADEQGVWNAGNFNVDWLAGLDYRHQLRWQAIRRANIILERIAGVPGVSEAYINQVTGEAKFMRAMNYFEMLKRYGGVPVVDKRLDLEDVRSGSLIRNSFEETVNFIVKDCDEAVAVLPNRYSSEMKGRATKGAALMVKAKTLLVAASPLFNATSSPVSLGANNNLVCYGNVDENRWQLAADASKAVLDWAAENGSHLITDQGPDKNYKYMWEAYDNPELLFINKSTNTRTVSQYPWLSMFPGSIYNSYESCSLTLNFLKFYEKKDGTPQTWDPKGGNDLNKKYAELDPRFAQSIMYNGSYLNPEFPVIQTFQGGRDAVNCKGGAWQRKLIPDALRRNTPAIPNNFIYRLGEAYLNYAEALNEAQGPVPEAYNAVNAIRNRSGMPDLPAGLTKEQFRARVRNERAIELIFEDNRVWDILRWKIAEEEGVMRGDMWGLKIYKIDNSSEFRYEPYVFETRTFTPRMYLHPFARAEVLKGNLVQNPGY